jgi:uncharacterized membrane protein YesL
MTTLDPGINLETYLGRTVRMLWESLPQLLRGALFFNLVGLPAFACFALGWLVPALAAAVVTLGPGWSALLAYETRLLQHREADGVWFWEAFRRHWVRSCLLGLLLAVPAGFLLALLPVLKAQATVPASVWFGIAANLLALGVTAILALYAFPNLVQRDLRTRDCIRDALILSSRNPAHSIGLLAMGVLFGMGVAHVSMGLVLLLPTVYGLFIAGNGLAVVEAEIEQG